MLAPALSRLLALLTFLLVLLGGVVHTTGSSLACPDWPLCFGEVMPPMQGGILYEHSHRLLASLVGAVTVALAAVLWRGRDRTQQRLGLTGVALVLAQGMLGGLTVILRLPPAVSIAHLGTSMAFFGWTIFMVVRCSQVPGPGLGVSRRPLVLAAAAVYAQILLGAVVRHRGASLACGLEALTCAGGWLPTTWLQALQSSHRALALVAVAAVVAGTLPTLRAARRRGRSALRGLVIGAHALVLLQVALGVLTIKTAVHLHVVTLHLGLGALLWADLVAVYLLAGPLGAPQAEARRAPSGGGFAPLGAP